MANVQQLNAAFGELREAEARVGALWRKGLFLYERGRLTEGGRAMFAAARDDLYAVEMRAYEFLVAAVGDIPGAGITDLAAGIPRPGRYSDLPTLPPAGSEARARYDAAGAERGVVRGLGAVPVVAPLVLPGVAAAPAVALSPWVLAAGVVVAVAAIAAVAYVLVNYGAYILAIIQFSIATSESARRYDDCMARGISMEECQQAHPGPTPIDPTNPLPWYFWAIIGTGVAAALGLGIYGYVKRKQVGAAFGAYKAASLSGPKKSEAFKFALPARGQGG